MELFCFPPVCRFMNSLADLYIKSIEENMNSVIYDYTVTDLLHASSKLDVSNYRLFSPSFHLFVY